MKRYVLYFPAITSHVSLLTLLSLLAILPIHAWFFTRQWLYIIVDSVCWSS